MRIIKQSEMFRMIEAAVARDANDPTHRSVLVQGNIFAKLAIVIYQLFLSFIFDKAIICF